MADLKGKLIDGKYLVSRHIDSGGFGSVYSATIRGSGKDVIVKIETNRHRDTLSTEALVYGKLKGIPGFPKFYHEGEYHGRSLIVVERLGMPLDNYWSQEKFNRRLPSGCIAGIVHQLLDALEFLHDKGYLHCDIKPNNIIVGDYNKPNSGKVYLIDFGCADKFLSSRGEHVSRRSKMQIIPNGPFASFRAHERKQQSRRDDLESLAYLMVACYKGELPWKGGSDDEDQMRAKKERVSAGSLFSGMPTEMAEFFRYVRKLQFSERPDYSKLRRLMSDVGRRKGYRSRFDLDKV